MDWRFQPYVTLAVLFSIQLRQWTVGFNVLDERKRPLEHYDFLMLNVFLGPLRVALMWEPMRREQLAYEVDLNRRAEDFERDLKALEKLKSGHELAPPIPPVA